MTFLRALDIQSLIRSLATVVRLKISDLISTGEVDTIISNVLDNGAYGAKLLGSGGCGFICVVGPSKAINKINHIYKDRVLNFEFDKEGSQTVLS